jgi:L-alanine-DL-glutamate epimerase-like enolase superfamily enzyme
MSRFRLSATVERWPVAGAFVIARGAKTHVDVLVVDIHEDGVTGRGEATPIYYFGETTDTCLAQIDALPDQFDRSELQHLLPAGAARNAVDCALWDLEAQQAGLSIAALAGLPEPKPLITAMTVSIGDPVAMEAEARRLAALTPLIKVKLSGDGYVERLAAVRRGAPYARLVVDANESWTGRDIAAEAATLLPFNLELIEQPVKNGQDHLLDGVACPIPLGADESCHDRDDLPRLVGRYQAINIKLDKAGGLTEALALKADAKAMGFRVMVGCMLSTSLGIAPAFLAAQGVDWADLDGALLLAEDRAERLILRDGLLHSRH